MHYTYYIKNNATGEKYYGVRTSKNCAPEEDIWIKYFTSSKVVRKWKDQDVTVEVRKIFETREQAATWELNVLRRLNVLHRADWVNNNIGGIIGPPTEETRKLLSTWEGRHHTQETKDKIRNALKGGKRVNPQNKDPAKIAKMAAKHRGMKRSPEACVNIIENAPFTKKWLITKPNGSQEEIKNLEKYCRDNGLTCTLMRHVAKGKQTHHKNYRCVCLE